MFKTPKKIWLLAMFGLSLAACQIREKGLPTWDMDLFGPVAKARLAFGDIEYSLPISFETEISTSQLYPGPYPAIATPIPGFSKASIGPFSTPAITQFSSITFASGTINFFITNNLPFNIKQGTTIEVKSGGSRIILHAIVSDIAIGGTYTLPQAAPLAGKVLSETLEIQFTNFESDGNPSSVLISGNEKLKAKIEVADPKISKITVKPNVKFEAQSSFAEFDLSGKEIKTGEVTGSLNLHTTNKMPASFTLQMYFYNEAKTVILDSAFTVLPEIQADNTNSTNCITSASKNGVVTKLTGNKGIVIDAARYNRIKDAAFIKGKVAFKSAPNSTSTILSCDSLQIQIIADIKLTIQ